MGKKILVFSNGEKIGDGIIKLQLLHEIKQDFQTINYIGLLIRVRLFIQVLLNSLQVIILMRFLIKQNLVHFFGIKYQKNII